MTRREEILLNITMLTAALSLLIFILLGPVPEDMAVPVASRSENRRTERPGQTETPLPPTAADRFMEVGRVPLFRALLTPTPTPPPPTPRPTPTPDISAGLAKFKVQGIMDGVVMLEDPEKSKTGAPDALIEWKPGEVRQMDSGRGETRPVKLEKVDEVTDPSNPTATFSMEGTTEKKVLKMFEQ
jgi:hypothetical protein